MPRDTTLVLVDQTGGMLGVLPTFTVAHPWWQDVDEVVRTAREAFGVDVQVLRLLHGHGEGRPASGGEVTYLAQVDTRTLSSPLPLIPAPGDLDLAEHPLRMPWARPGGPAASVAWAQAALERRGLHDIDAAQQRSWNLSAIWRMDAPAGTVAWLKQVPPFFAHEPEVLRLVRAAAPALAPEPLAADDHGRILLADVPGIDGHGADAETRVRITELFHPVQARYAGAADELLAAGLPDRRLKAERFVDVARLWSESVDGIRELIEALPARLERVAACGLPDTLVHGDLHAGNVRLGGAEPVVIDWGDASLSHPAYDILLLTKVLSDSDAASVHDEWVRTWRRTAPSSDPRGALELMRPLAEWRAAVTMHDFLTHIEPSERVYHLDDARAAMKDAVDAAG
ncbi:aminoglycoside phosphotransferase family protein [Planctomonas sp. JC2975]|uniref:phosphotransferase family protein n=1 Tax=Planctomonas sp. JC2975 TaxID=2729626 RepID=UPI00147295D5|nr:aminoglycoside phosphotransferase family protein [Planctomonas sp. JC2975]NNC11231.1 aminoglycoside phosphotransferase family protein [Planctomonas sp. JC2975]